MKILLDESYVLVQVDTKHKLIEVIWKKFAMSKQYRETIQLAYEAIKSQQLVGWLSDMSKAGVVDLQDQQWMKEEMIPKCITAGIIKTAVVDSQDIFSKKYVASLEAEFPSSTAMHFGDIISARKWLKKENVLN